VGRFTTTDRTNLNYPYQCFPLNFTSRFAFFDWTEGFARSWTVDGTADSSAVPSLLTATDVFVSISHHLFAYEHDR
jgi:hypothetical protein